LELGEETVMDDPLVQFTLYFAACVLIWKLIAWLSESTPYPEEKPMEHETPDEYCGCAKPGMARVDYLKFLYMRCGHCRFEWTDLHGGVCLQCVAEGRTAVKDLGRVRP